MNSPVSSISIQSPCSSNKCLIMRYGNSQSGAIR
ncbi:hypothetical protein V6Z12_A07G135600 [Gossypium hirsutum]